MSVEEHRTALQSVTIGLTLLASAPEARWAKTFPNAHSAPLLTPQHDATKRT